MLTIYTAITVKQEDAVSVKASSAEFPVTTVIRLVSQLCRLHRMREMRLPSFSHEGDLALIPTNINTKCARRKWMRITNLDRRSLHVVENVNLKTKVDDQR